MDEDSMNDTGPTDTERLREYDEAFALVVEHYAELRYRGDVPEGDCERWTIVGENYRGTRPDEGEFGEGATLGEALAEFKVSLKPQNKEDSAEAFERLESLRKLGAVLFTDEVSPNEEFLSAADAALTKHSSIFVSSELAADIAEGNEETADEKEDEPDE